MASGRVDYPPPSVRQLGAPPRAKKGAVLHAIISIAGPVPFHFRPLDAPEPDELGGDPAQIEECQIAAFEAGDEDWWRYGVDFVAYAKNEFGDWAPIEDQDEGHTGGTSGPQ